MVFTDEQRRVLLNLDQFYAAYREHEAVVRSSGPLHWKTVSGRDYLYEGIDNRGNAKSREDVLPPLYSWLRCERLPLP